MRVVRTLGVISLALTFPTLVGCGVAQAPASDATAATVRTSRGSDFDGDGRADLAIGAPAAHDKTGRVFVFPGDGSAMHTLEGALVIQGRFGTAVASLGDVNRDGYDDLAVGSEREGRVYVYYGGAGGLVDARRMVIAAPTGAEEHFGRTVAALGDVDGDGYPDLAVADAGPAPRVYLFAGGSAGIGNEARAVLTSPSASASFGWALVGADIDGDGRAEVLVSQPFVGVERGYGEVMVYAGGAWDALSGSRPAQVLNNPDAGVFDFGYALALAGDVNGDGHADILVGTYSDSGRAYVFHGSAGGLAGEPSTTLTPPAGTGAHGGLSVSSAGDVNGDGYADVLVGAAGSEQSAPGAAALYLGGAHGLGAQPDATVQGPDGAGFGWFVGAAGDLDGDGRSDVMVGAPFEKQGEGRAYVFTGATLTPHGVFAAPGSFPAEFGRVATR